MQRFTRAALLAASSLALMPSLASAGPLDSTVLGIFDVDAPDSALARQAYGVVGYSNPYSTRSLSASQGSLTLSTTMATEPGQPYSAAAGILLPIEPMWGIHDLRGATSISFRVKANQRTRFQFGVGSNAYLYGDQGIFLQINLPVTTEWQTVTLDLTPYTDLAYPAWVDEFQFPGVFDAGWITDSTDPNFDSDLNVAKSVKNLIFAPEALYVAGGTQVVSPVGTLELSIDDVVLHGVSLEEPPVVEPPPGPRGRGHHHGHNKPRPPRNDNGCKDRSGSRK